VISRFLTRILQFRCRDTLSDVISLIWYIVSNTTVRL